MSIYVDDLFTWPGKRGQWCHMMTDGDLSELHEFAKRIGLKRSWFQNKLRLPHYDLRPSMRERAIQAGAIEVSGVELAQKCKRVAPEPHQTPGDAPGVVSDAPTSC